MNPSNREEAEPVEDAIPVWTPPLDTMSVHDVSRITGPADQTGNDLVGTDTHS